MSKTYKLYTINDVDYIEATALTDLQRENERLKEIISYLPKVPTQPYEKEMAKKIIELKQQVADYEKALELKVNHEDDCMDKDETFTDNECCECGASIVHQLLTKYKDK